jgi:NAD(P)-dependent dehydrogenase (short-subunit alcohol dehydrogenase family)
MLHQKGYELELIDVKTLALSDVAESLGAYKQVVDLSHRGPVLDYSPDVLVCAHGISAAGWRWREVINTNLTGVWNTIKACEPMEDASIVLIGSMTGHIVGNYPFTGIESYAASKAGLVGLCRQYAVSHAKNNVTCNLVLPGPVQTPMTDAFKKRNPELHKEFFDRCLLRGSTHPQDIAEAVLYLVGAKRVTGQTLVVDGGYTIW